MKSSAPQAVTMQAVAAHAGVSISTVSHVINGTRRVKPETEATVRRALSETGYVGDRVARSLRTGESRTIGLAMSAISNQYFATVVQALEKAFADSDYTILLSDTHDEPDRELRAVQELVSHRPAGIVLAPSAQPAQALAYARARGVPVVSIDRMTPGVDSVGVENRAATGRLVDHLVEVGHRRIGIVTGRLGLATSQERLAGYVDALARHDLPRDDALIVDGDSDDQVAAAAVGALLAGPTRPSALVVTNNRMTIGAMRALTEAGLRVPADLALVAFDDFEWSDLFEPRLTAIAQPVDRIADEAVSLLWRRIAAPDQAPQHVVLEPAYVHRSSCGCPHS